MKARNLLPALLLSTLALAGCTSTQVTSTPVAPVTATPQASSTPTNPTNDVTTGTQIAVLQQPSTDGTASHTFVVPTNGYVINVNCEGATTAKIQLTVNLASQQNADGSLTASRPYTSAFTCDKLDLTTVNQGGAKVNAGRAALASLSILSGTATKITATITAK